METWTRQSTQENGEVPQQCKKELKEKLYEESLSCNTKHPSDREDILWNQNCGATAPSRPRPHYRGSTIVKGLKINVI